MNAISSLAAACAAAPPERFPGCPDSWPTRRRPDVAHHFLNPGRPSHHSSGARTSDTLGDLPEAGVVRTFHLFGSLYRAE